jgi:uncharacterized glyoxalase superfamily protein PhnB
MLLSLTPMLQTESIPETKQWYAEALGFTCVSRPDDNWCHLVKDKVELMFMTNDHLGKPQATATQYIVVDDVMTLYDDIKHRVTVEWGPERMSYGKLEFAIRDNNGYLLSFGQDISRP